ncbi:hypothetical protein [Streptomyces sp. NPDC055912]|uniref:hypothetical protein n=1 Tax=Streptomyces sp. NPDC055912 TaxID=3345660 RepID=UPI0035DBA9C5
MGGGTEHPLTAADDLADVLARELLQAYGCLGLGGELRHRGGKRLTPERRRWCAPG